MPTIEHSKQPKMDDEVLESSEQQQLGRERSLSPDSASPPEGNDKTSAKRTRTRRRGRHRAPLACTGCRARKVRCNVILIGPPCYNCTQDGKSCEKPTGRRQKNASPDLEEPLNNRWPQKLLEKETVSPPKTENPFAGEFGFAGDLQCLLEAHFHAISDCPCEQFGILACPFCDTENLSSHVIKGTENR